MINFIFRIEFALKNQQVMKIVKRGEGLSPKSKAI